MCRASGSKHLIGSVARVRSCRPNLIFSDKTYRISIDENLIDPDFFVFAMKSKYIREQIELSISGADGLANNIPQASVKSYQFVLPEIDEQRAIVKVLTEKSDRISLQEEKTKAVIERLQEYRSALITNAVTGKIDVRDFCVPTTTEQRGGCPWLIRRPPIATTTALKASEERMNTATSSGQPGSWHRSWSTSSGEISFRLLIRRSRPARSQETRARPLC